MLCPLAIGVLVVVTAAAGVAGTDRQTRTLPLPAGPAISVDITIGEVRIEGSPRVDAVRRARAGPLR